MLIEKRIIKQPGIRKKVIEYLIRCEKCEQEKWLTGRKCKFGKLKFCSRKCSNLGRKRTEEWKGKISKKFSGIGNPFYGKQHTEENCKKCKQSGARMLEIKKEELGIEYDEWYTRYCKKISLSSSGIKNHFYGKHHSDKTKAIQSSIKCDKIASGELVLRNFNRGIKGWYHSIKMNEDFYYDSFWELLKMKLLDNNSHIISWTKKHGIKIPYKNKYYVPDFLITYKDRKVIEEVKGFENAKKKLDKFNALVNYCIENGFQYKITEYEELNKICLEVWGHSILTLRMYFKKGKFI